MNRLALSAVAISLAACSVAQAKGITGSGQPRTEARTTPPFTEIEVRGAIAADVTVGSAQTIAVSGDDNVVPIIRTTVKKGRLIIDARSPYTTRRGVSVTITVPNLLALGASGSSGVTVRGVDGEALALAVSGSGSIEATGKAARLALAVSGSGSLHARGVVSDDATVAVSGSGGAELSVARGLTVQLSGSGTVDYWGDPAVTQAISGSGTLRRH